MEQKIRYLLYPNFELSMTKNISREENCTLVCVSTHFQISLIFLSFSNPKYALIC